MDIDTSMRFARSRANKRAITLHLPPELLEKCRLGAVNDHRTLQAFCEVALEIAVAGRDASAQRFINPSAIGR